MNARLLSLLVFTAGCQPEPRQPISYQLSEVETYEDLPETDEGRFGFKQVQASLLAHPVRNDEWEPTITTSWSLADITRDGTTLTWSETLCDLNTTENFGTRSIYPRAFINNMPTRTRTMFFSEQASGATVETERFVDINGACLLYTSPSPRDRTRSRMPSSA